jgi:hypothetical protein
MTSIAKIAATALIAAAVAAPATAYAGINLPGLVPNVENALLAQRQAHGVTLDSVGKEVEPGVVQVDPKAVYGRRIVFSPSVPPPQLVCFGSWHAGVCKGFVMDLRQQAQPGVSPAAAAPAPTPTPVPQ